MLDKLLRFLFPNYIDLLGIRAYSQGYDERKAEERLSKEINKGTLFNKMIAKPIFTLSNTWEDPTFGIVVNTITEKGERHLQAVNILTSEIYTVHGKVFLADEKLVKAVLKLDPMERWNLHVSHIYGENLWTEPPEGYKPTDPIELFNKLKAQGFFKVLNHA